MLSWVWKENKHFKCLAWSCFIGGVCFVLIFSNISIFWCLGKILRCDCGISWVPLPRVLLLTKQLPLRRIFWNVVKDEQCTTSDDRRPNSCLSKVKWMFTNSHVRNYAKMCLLSLKWTEKSWISALCREVALHYTYSVIANKSKHE